MRLARVVAIASVVGAACAPPRSSSEPIANRSRARSLFPADRADCTQQGWCRFAKPPPLDVTDLYVDHQALYVVGAIGEVDVESDTAAIARWDGDSWKTWRLGGAVLMSIDGSQSRTGTTALWAAGRKTHVYRFTGDDWESGELETYDPAKVAVSGNEVFVGFDGGIVRRDGAEWSTVLQRSVDQTLYDLADDDAGNAWAIVKPDPTEPRPYAYHRERRAFEPLGGERDIYRIAARDPRDVFVLGNGGLWRHDGQRWTQLPYDAKMGQSALVVREGKLVALGGIDEERSGVAFIDGSHTIVHELPDDCEALAAAPDGSLWVGSSRDNHIWFRPR